MAKQGRQLGDLTLARAVEMVMPFDRQSFFPDTTPEDWVPHEGWMKPQAMDPATGDVLFTVQSYVVRSPHHTILIDSCVGNHKERATRPLWHQKTDDTYLRALASLELAPEDIDYVLCTHLHADHVGWNTRLVDGRWVPTFPNARYVFSKKELEAWQHGGDARFTRDPLEDSVLPVIEAGKAQLVNHDFALDDCVWLEPSPGHTPDHVSIRLASGGHNAVMSGDLMHSPVQCLHPEWTAWPDWDAEQAKRTRHGFMERYADTDMLVCTAHFPLPSAGRIVGDGDAFRFEAEADW